MSEKRCFAKTSEQSNESLGHEFITFEILQSFGSEQATAIYLYSASRTFVKINICHETDPTE